MGIAQLSSDHASLDDCDLTSSNVHETAFTGNFRQRVNNLSPIPEAEDVLEQSSLSSTLPPLPPKEEETASCSSTHIAIFDTKDKAFFYEVDLKADFVGILPHTVKTKTATETRTLGSSRSLTEEERILAARDLERTSSRARGDQDEGKVIAFIDLSGSSQDDGSNDYTEL